MRSVFSNRLVMVCVDEFSRATDTEYEVSTTIRLFRTYQAEPVVHCACESNRTEYLHPQLDDRCRCIGGCASQDPDFPTIYLDLPRRGLGPHILREIKQQVNNGKPQCNIAGRDT